MYRKVIIIYFTYLFLVLPQIQQKIRVLHQMNSTMKEMELLLKLITEKIWK